MRFIEPVRPRRTRGLVADVYAEVRRDFALLRDPEGNSPWLAQSPDPEILAGFWSAFYETVVAEGSVERADKELIAAAVSLGNDCPFCVDAHSFLCRVAGESGAARALSEGRIAGIDDLGKRALAAWATATREPGSKTAQRLPFGTREAPEIIGTALAFHYANRIVEVFQGHRGLNFGPAPLRRMTIPSVAVVARRAMRRRHEPGRALSSLPEAELPEDLEWARAAPTVATAWASFARAVEHGGSAVLSPPERGFVISVLEDWDGRGQPVHSGSIEQALRAVSPRSRPAVRLALLAAFAPDQVDEDIVEHFRRTCPGDRELVRAVSWAALRAVRRIAAILTQGGGRYAAGPASAPGMTATQASSSAKPASAERMAASAFQARGKPA
jgi:AhpD family alkylhydroperoxidase